MKSFKKTSLIFIFLIFSLPLFSVENEEFLEKVELEKLPPADEYYIDDSPLNQILKLFDEEDYERQKAFLEHKQKKIIKEAGGIKLSQGKYEQEIIHEYIARYMTQFGKESLYKILDDGEYYRLYVRQELKKRNMPAILEYLPLVESEYKPTAKSRSGARGLWQFMENSMAPFLKKNEWFDERLDPWKATSAALSKLQDNYKTFNDWPLAIGAYNCGAGAMRRALQKSPVKSFWYLSEHNLIPEETINYVPKLIAINEIAENGEEYKVTLPKISESRHYADFDYATSSREISLDRLAQEIRLDHSILKSLNTELLQGKTPPYNYQLRLPMGMKRAAQEAIFEIERMQ
ncbi:hypothetical protein DYE50_07860 [Treponema ruminis]|uniref:Membrane-bound lytic murein transglycosylase D n=1 Tax=Treponema ruminis TaxID=744515 RepID=A0A7W8G8N8_9SPIR|nr:lytic transglycosylase domain-containing protein [Treponema ruminis]MBB5225792.1 membrane-bound lytic murein transglycosylase D [Treponema ruminis]QSI02481.1 hypothetical protein DYE50_07860 [Treponema ruminis]